MMQFLNNILYSLTQENPQLLNILLIPAGFVESYLVITFSLIFFDIKLKNSQKLFYIFLMSTLSTVASSIISEPYNIFINYTCILFLFKYIFKLNILKSVITLALSTFIFGLLNILLQNPYMSLLNISLDMLLNVPIYRLSFLSLLYICLFIICIILKKVKKFRFSLDFLDKFR